MLDLTGVTLCCIDTANHALALRALMRSQAGITFGRILFLTHGVAPDVVVPSGIDAVNIDSLPSRADYSRFVLKSLVKHITTPHVLLVQWDGFVVNPQAWDPAFLECDYLGAKWFWHQDGMRVGNGGFSLRSRRLLDALQDARIAPFEAEDETIGRTFRPLLEQDYGIRFGSEALADRFAFEAAYPIGKPFGFHGLFNFCRTVPQAEIVAMAPGFSDAIARSPQLGQLLRNCAAMAQWQAVAAIAARVLAADANATEAVTLLQRAQRELAQPAVASRNDPCPCGSGRRYKQCHGVLRREGRASIEPPSATAITAITASSIDADVAKALVAHQRGDLTAAEHGYRAALARAPAHALATHFLGVVFYQTQRIDAALPLLTRAAAAVPQEPEFHNNLGLALAAADRNDEAVAAYRRTIALIPDHAVAWNNLGLVLQASNALPEAIAAFRKALALHPEFGQAHWNLALALLAHGDFEEGWQEYEWRLTLAELGERAAIPAGPRWDGKIEPGLRLLLTAEQGLGDALQFVRFARILCARGMVVFIQAPSVLLHLLATAPGVAGVYGPDDVLPHYDVHLPMLSVARALSVGSGTADSGTASGERPRGQAPYLVADPVRRTELRGRLSPFAGKLKVGLCWAGSKLHANDHRRSLPFTALQPLMMLREVAWFSLQKDLTVGAPLHEWPARNDFDDLAALIAELDLVITVDTSIAHLAGALARPTWILLAYAPDWRWQLARDDSAWYPTARLFRQRTVGDWNGVVAAIRDALLLMVAERE